MNETELPLVQEFKPEHYLPFARLWNQNYPHRKITSTNLRLQDIYGSGEIRAGRWAAELGGEVVGVAAYENLPGELYHPQKFMLHTIVAPASQGRGIGKVLAATALREVMKHRPLSLSVLINGDSLRSARFANACGFALAMEWDYSRLDLARFAAQDFGKWEKRLQREGYEFLPFTELPDMAERIAELHSLYCQVRRAAPSGEERRLPDAKDFTDAYTQQPQLFERYLVGLRRGRLTGLATLENQPHTDSELYNEITGVHPACYHRGVIMGLITCAARWARERGFAFINAENVVTNKNIIPVMRRIGFQRISRWQLFRKEF